MTILRENETRKFSVVLRRKTAALQAGILMALVLAVAIGAKGQGAGGRVAESPTAGRINPAERGDSSLLEAQKKLGFVGWIQPVQLGWEPFRIPGVPDAEYKLLSIDPVSGARSQLTHVPAGWTRPKGYQSSGREIFLLSGDLTVGDDRMTKYSYAYYPAGYAQPEAHSEHGAEFLDWWEGEPDFVASEQSRSGTRMDELVNHWNFYDEPWTKPEDFPKWAAVPAPPGVILLKLMRKDKITGAMSWINMSGAHAAKGSAWAGYVKWGTEVGGNWEVHTSWEEGIVVEGDMTMGECLPGRGEVVGTYTAGGYFFRPAGIRHVGPSMHTDSYAMVLQRTGSPIWADYYRTCNAEPGTQKGTQ